MFKCVILLFCIAGLNSSVHSQYSVNSVFDSVFVMPEIVVEAPRFEYEDDAWSGLMPEVVVTAPRFQAEDVDSEIGMSTRRTSQGEIDRLPFSIDINVIIILSVLGSMILFIGLYVLPYFQRKADVRTK